METTTLVRLRRIEEPADPAVLVATRMIGFLGRTRHVELDKVDHDSILLHVGPEIGQAPVDGWAGQLLGQVRDLLRGPVFAGWEPEPLR